MAPCVGEPGVCPPLCRWAELEDGTYSLADVERFNQTIWLMRDRYQRAMRNQR